MTTSDQTNNKKGFINWGQLVGISLTILGCVIGYLAIPRGELTWAAHPALTLVSQELAGQKRVTVLLENKVVHTLVLTEFKIRNTGNQAIRQTDYDSLTANGAHGLYISAQDSVRVLAAEADGIESPGRLTEHVLVKDDGTVYVPAIGLNPGEAYSVKLFCEKAPTNFKITGHIEGASIRSARDSFNQYMTVSKILGWLSGGLFLLLLNVLPQTPIFKKLSARAAKQYLTVFSVVGVAVLICIFVETYLQFNSPDYF